MKRMIETDVKSIIYYYLLIKYLQIICYIKFWKPSKIEGYFMKEQILHLKKETAT